MPNSIALHAQMISQLRDRFTRPVKVGLCSLVPDYENNLVWGVDPYGVDHIASRGLSDKSLARAIAWAEKCNTTTSPHAAEASARSNR
jgi:hypothetical protein